MSCNCTPASSSGNDVYGIPLKIGFPLSTACERANIVGSIPQVIRYAGFTLINGGLLASKPSNGGIGNPSNFFQYRSGCFGTFNGGLSGSECCVED